MSVCLSVREDISRTTCAIFTIFCACCLCPWLGPSSPDMFTIGRIAYRRKGFFPHWKCIIGRERGDGSAQCGRSMLSTIALFSFVLQSHVIVHCKSKSSKYFTRYGVTTGLRWVGIFRDDLITNWLLSLKLKEMWKSVSILKLYGRSVAATFWVTRTVPIYPVLYQSVCVLVLF